MTDATLTLTRKTLGVQHRPFDVLLDHALVATIDYGTSIDLRLAPGSRRLQITRGRLTSPERFVDAHDGEAIAFWCRGALLWPIYVAALLKPDLGIALTPEPA
jgi:hypothetical protein